MGSLHLCLESLNPNNCVLCLNAAFVDVHINAPKITSRLQVRVSVHVTIAMLKSLRLMVQNVCAEGKSIYCSELEISGPQKFWVWFSR